MQLQQQIPFGDDNKKGKCKGEGQVRINAIATADPLGDDNKKGKCKGKGMPARPNSFTIEG
jgi:hypothetical protein